KKQIAVDTPQTEKSGSSFKSLYFDLKSNPGVKVPNRFPSLEAAVAFMKKNFRQVDSAGRPYATSESKVVKLTDDIEAPEVESSPNGGASFALIEGTNAGIWPEQQMVGYLYDGAVDAGEFCPTWLYDAFTYGGSKHVWESIEAAYTQRGIICVLTFAVKYAPRPFNAPRRTKMVYGVSSFPNNLAITGGAVGTLNNPQIDFVMDPEGTGVIHAYQIETRTAVYTNNDTRNFELKSGDASNYPIGMSMGNGRTVTGALNSITTYTLYYRLTFYDTNVDHYHDVYSGYCHFENDTPIMGSEDIGTVFVGVPRN
ncbi:MAG: hypothetical protein JST39_16820, partial [Bacteroidetes bacterium]|nr:hypothetical protein [Bacteroidota bacterium]